MSSEPDPEPCSWLERPSQFGKTSTPQWRKDVDPREVGLLLAKLQHEIAFRFRDRMAAKAEGDGIDWRYGTGLGEAIGVSPKTVNKILQGQSPMKLKFLVAAAEALNLSIELNLHPPMHEVPSETESR